MNLNLKEQCKERKHEIVNYAFELFSNKPKELKVAMYELVDRMVEEQFPKSEENVENAEELVDRMCKSWLKAKTFPNTRPLTDPDMKNSIIEELKKIDDIYKKYEKEIIIDLEKVKKEREYIVLKEIAIIFSVAADMICEPPPKPTHRKKFEKVRYLRAVANG